MQLNIIPTDERGGFRIEGELDLASEPELTSLMTDALAKGHVITLDLSTVSFIDSSGLRALLKVASSGPEDGATRVVLVQPSTAVRRLLDLTIPGGAPGLEIRD
jgi:anti-anti-sigma factor